MLIESSDKNITAKELFMDRINLRILLMNRIHKRSQGAMKSIIFQETIF